MHDQIDRVASWSTSLIFRRYGWVVFECNMEIMSSDISIIVCVNLVLQHLSCTDGLIANCGLFWLVIIAAVAAAVRSACFLWYRGLFLLE